MSKFDIEYLKLCKKILEEGKKQENRTGIDTIKIPSYHFHFDLEDEFPMLTTKQVFYKNAITEMLWIYQAQSNDVRWLQERGNHIWDEWEIGEDGIWRATQNIPNKDGVLEKVNVEKDFGKERAHTIGTAYGWIVNKYHLIDELLDKIKNNPTDRRMVMSLWQNEFLDTAVLPSCVWSSEWDVTDDKLNLWVHQRSSDVPLGLPFNVTQYAVLQSMLAHCTDLEPGTMDWSIKDAHIYENQVEGIKMQIKRGETLEDLPAPELWLNPEVRNFYEFDNSRELKDIKIRKYKHHGKISFPIAQ
ncbi:MAG: thymidylate synthase [Bacilli bacterium]